MYYYKKRTTRSLINRVANGSASRADQHALAHGAASNLRIFRETSHEAQDRESAGDLDGASRLNAVLPRSNSSASSIVRISPQNSMPRVQSQPSLQGASPRYSNQGDQPPTAVRWDPALTAGLLAEGGMSRSRSSPSIQETQQEALTLPMGQQPDNQVRRTTRRRSEPKSRAPALRRVREAPHGTEEAELSWSSGTSPRTSPKNRGRTEPSTRQGPDRPIRNEEVVPQDPGQLRGALPAAFDEESGERVLETRAVVRNQGGPLRQMFGQDPARSPVSNGRPSEIRSPNLSPILAPAPDTRPAAAKLSRPRRRSLTERLFQGFGKRKSVPDQPASQDREQPALTRVTQAQPPESIDATLDRAQFQARKHTRPRHSLQFGESQAHIDRIMERSPRQQSTIEQRRQELRGLQAAQAQARDIYLWQYGVSEANRSQAQSEAQPSSQTDSNVSTYELKRKQPGTREAARAQYRARAIAQVQVQVQVEEKKERQQELQKLERRLQQQSISGGSSRGQAQPLVPSGTGSGSVQVQPQVQAKAPSASRQSPRAQAQPDPLDGPNLSQTVGTPSFREGYRAAEAREASGSASGLGPGSGGRPIPGRARRHLFEHEHESSPSSAPPRADSSPQTQTPTPMQQSPPSRTGTPRATRLSRPPTGPQLGPVSPRTRARAREAARPRARSGLLEAEQEAEEMEEGRVRQRSPKAPAQR